MTVYLHATNSPDRREFIAYIVLLLSSNPRCTSCMVMMMSSARDNVRSSDNYRPIYACDRLCAIDYGRSKCPSAR